MCNGKGSPWNLWLYMMWDNSLVYLLVFSLGSYFFKILHGVGTIIVGHTVVEKPSFSAMA
jgi:hypothetical protein